MTGGGGGILDGRGGAFRTFTPGVTGINTF